MKDALGSFAHSGKIFASHRPAVGGRTSVDILISSTIPSFSNPREMIVGLRASRGVNWRCFRGARFQSRAIEDTFANQTLEVEPSWALKISARLGQSLPERLGKCLLRQSLHITTWGQLGPTLANLGPIWDQLELTWAILGPTWSLLGANLGPTWA